MQIRLLNIFFFRFQVKSGTIFDNVLITDDVEYAKKAIANLKTTQEGEKQAKEVKDKEEAEAAKDESNDAENDDEEEDDVDNEPQVEVGLL